MPRKARKVSQSGIYHVMFRGVNRQTIFEDDEDREKFKYVLKDCKEKSKFSLYSYCLMRNHVHMLMNPEEEQLSTIIKRIGVRYVYWFNNKYQRCGHLFQDRFRSEPVEDDNYFLTALRYIHQNPVKAGLVVNACEFKWSSHNDYFTHDSLIVDTKFGLSLFSSNQKSALCAYKDYMNSDTVDDVDAKCLEIDENKFRLTDNELIMRIRERYEIESEKIQHLQQEKQNEIIKWAKYDAGASLRQIARVAGVTVNRAFKA